MSEPCYLLSYYLFYVKVHLHDLFPKLLSYNRFVELESRVAVEELSEERPGILLWMLEGLHRLLANRYQFTISERSIQNLEAAMADSDNQTYAPVLVEPEILLPEIACCRRLPGTDGKETLAFPYLRPTRYGKARVSL